MSVMTFGPDFASTLFANLSGVFQYKKQDGKNTELAHLREVLVKPIRRWLLEDDFILLAAYNDEQRGKLREVAFSSLHRSYFSAAIDAGEIDIIIQMLHHANKLAYATRYREEAEAYILPYHKRPLDNELSFHNLMHLAKQIEFIKYQIYGEVGPELEFIEEWLKDLHNAAAVTALNFHDDSQLIQWGE